MADELTFLDDDPDEGARRPRGRRVGQPTDTPPEVAPEAVAAATGTVRTVTVAHPFQVVHEGVAHWPNAVLEVPPELADEWLINGWVLP
jgi:hypothetical protein